MYHFKQTLKHTMDLKFCHMDRQDLRVVSLDAHNNLYFLQKMSLLFCAYVLYIIDETVKYQSKQLLNIICVIVKTGDNKIYIGENMM